MTNNVHLSDNHFLNLPPLYYMGPVESNVFNSYQSNIRPFYITTYFLTVPKLLAFAVNMKVVKTAERQMVAKYE